VVKTDCEYIIVGLFLYFYTMNPDFSVQFRLDRKNNDLRIILTDASTGFSSSVIAGLFNVTYPDGTINKNVDSGSPDISAVNGSFDGELKFDAFSKIQQGSYVIQYTVIHSVDGTFVETKSFSLNWIEPILSFTNNSDLLIPEVIFTDEINYSKSGFSEVDTRDISCFFPVTSDLTGLELTTTSTEIDMVNAGDYYEGLYDPELDVVVTYTHTSNAYLSVYYNDLFTEEIDIRKAPIQEEILEFINTFKDAQEAYINLSTDRYNREEAKYQKIMARYTHLFDRVVLGQLQESQDILDEMLVLLNIPSYPYESGAIEGVTVINNDHGLLVGLADDDHPQYLTEIRLDALNVLVKEIDSNVTITSPGTYIFTPTANRALTMLDLATFQNKIVTIKNRNSSGFYVSVQRAGTDELYTSSVKTVIALADGESITFVGEDYWTSI
jgi:hypothetical protein